MSFEGFQLGSIFRIFYDFAESTCLRDLRCSDACSCCSNSKSCFGVIRFCVDDVIFSGFFYGVVLLPSLDRDIKKVTDESCYECVNEDKCDLDELMVCEHLKGYLVKERENHRAQSAEEHEETVYGLFAYDINDKRYNCKDDAEYKR